MQGVANFALRRRNAGNSLLTRKFRLCKSAEKNCSEAGSYYSSLACIKFIEEQTGEKFDRDAYFAAMKVYNRETEYELQKWEINKTK